MQEKYPAELMDDVSTLFGELQKPMQAAFRGLGKGAVTPQTVQFYKTFDKMTAESKGSVSCKPGCTYCCHYHVMVSATEVFALVEAIEKLPTSTREVVKNRVHAVASRVKEMPSQVYMKTNVECAMLLEGKCSVYAARPVPCRGHHSADVSICKETFDDVHSSASAPRDYHREVVFRTFDHIQLAANSHAGVDATKYELHAALSTALSNPTAFKRWKSGKSAFPAVTDKVTLAEMMAGT
jgi:Fe-S-cluster containining protein